MPVLVVGVSGTAVVVVATNGTGLGRGFAIITEVAAGTLGALGAFCEPRTTTRSLNESPPAVFLGALALNGEETLTVKSEGTGMVGVSVCIGCRTTGG